VRTGIRQRIGGALCILALTVSCGSQQVAAPITSTVPTTIVSRVNVTTTVKVTATVTPPAQTTRVTAIVTKTAPPVTKAAEPPGPTTAFDDGTYLVGKDVQPGSYQASATGNECYWVRKDKAGNIIDNDFGTVATIQDGDFTFQSERCGSWTKVG
jgi:hypothetical protein